LAVFAFEDPVKITLIGGSRVFLALSHPSIGMYIAPYKTLGDLDIVRLEERLRPGKCRTIVWRGSSVTEWWTAVYTLQETTKSWNIPCSCVVASLELRIFQRTEQVVGCGDLS
jgi:hypothetical protein